MDAPQLGIAQRQCPTETAIASEPSKASLLLFPFWTIMGTFRRLRTIYRLWDFVHFLTSGLLQETPHPHQAATANDNIKTSPPQHFNALIHHVFNRA